jgi:TetR/AcrR family transcriptional repressor of mexCD-oprJ operon
MSTATTTVAAAGLAAHIADARLDAVPLDEALARLTRAVIAATRKYRALALFGKPHDISAGFDRDILEPARALFHRGEAEERFRTDLSNQTLTELYFGLVEGAVSRVVQGRLGVEQASAAITTIFLTGALRDPARQ